MSVRGPRHRPAGRVGAAVVAVALCAWLGMPSQAASQHLQPTPSTDAAAGDGFGPATTITLVSGDVLQVRADAQGRLAVSTNGSGQSSFARFTDPDGDLHVIPGQLLPLIPDRLDPRLFNISALVRDGYGTPAAGSADPKLPGGALPLIVTYTASSVPVPGAVVRQQLPSIRGAAITLDQVGAEALGGALSVGRSALPGVAKIWLDGPMKAALDESVPQIGAPTAWEQGFDGTGVTIAVVDTGVDDSHPDLAGRVVASKLFAEADDVTDVFGHGTHVASIAAGDGAASDGQFTGVAYAADLVNAKVLDDSGSGLESWVIAGMEWAATAQDADIVNLSLTGGPSDGTDPVSQAVDNLTAEEGALFVTAAGNFGGFPESVETPSTAASALAVGAVDKSDVLAYFSAWGPRPGGTLVKPEIVAPGVDITAARAAGSEIGPPVGEDYMELSGTSMAAPHVAGAAALLLQAHPGWSWSDLKNNLVTTAADVGAEVYQQGGGRVDVASALAQTVHSDTATIDLGTLEYPHDDGEISSVDVALTNDGETEAALDLATVASAEDGTAAPTGMLTVTPESLVLAPGASGTVTVTFDGAVGPIALFTGLLTASVEGVAALHVPLAFEKEPQLVDLSMDVIARDSADDLSGVINVQNVDDIETYFAQFEVFTGQETATARVPLGTYSVTLLSFQPSGGGVDVVGVLEPEVEVSQDTELVLDSNDTNEITVDVGADASIVDATIDVFRASEGDQFGVETAFGAGGPESRAFVNETETATTGQFEFYSKWTLTGEDDRAYDLIFPESDSVPADVAYVVGAEDVATIENSFHADVKRDYFEGRFAFRPYSFGAFASLYPLAVPVVRTDWVTADDTSWQQTIDIGGFDSFAPIDEAAPTMYEPGAELNNSWVESPSRPAYTGGFREGDTMFLSTAAWTDQQDHPGFESFAFGEPYETFSLTLSADGDEVGSTDTPYGEFAVPAGPAMYELHLEAARDISWWKHSTQTSTTWTFPSDTADPPADFVLPQVGYDIDLDLRNATDGPNAVSFTVADTPGMTAVSGFSGSWSIDDGDTWTALELTEADGAYAGFVPVPPGCEPSCFVSLRVAAEGTDGTSISQDVIRAYTATYVAPPTSPPPSTQPPTVTPTITVTATPPVPTTTLPGTGGGKSGLLAGLGLAGVAIGGLAVAVARRNLNREH